MTLCRQFVSPAKILLLHCYSNCLLQLFSELLIIAWSKKRGLPPVDERRRANHAEHQFIKQGACIQGRKEDKPTPLFVLECTSVND